MCKYTKYFLKPVWNDDYFHGGYEIMKDLTLQLPVKSGLRSYGGLQTIYMNNNDQTNNLIKWFIMIGDFVLLNK